MNRLMTVAILAIVLGIQIISSVSCNALKPDGPKGDAPPTPTLTPRAPEGSFLEKRGQDIGVTKDTDGHLTVRGNDPQVRIFRLVTFLNNEARSREKDGKLYPYKLIGLYGAAVVGSDYGDRVDCRLQISFDDFEPQVALPQLAKDLGISISSQGYLTLESEDSYRNLDALLTYRNAQASNDGGDYKFKAWYDRKELNGEFISDRVDIMAQLSFEQPFPPPSRDLALYTRSTSLTEARQNSLIATVAVEFSQLLKKPRASEALTVTILDFAGDRDHGPERTYMFDEEAVKRLKEIRMAKGESLNADDILALAEVKNRAGQIRRSSNDAPRTEEPIAMEAVDTVAYIATEIARALRPSAGLSIVTYDFTGKAPKKLVTWAYEFDGGAIEVIRTKNLTPQEVLKQARVSEYAGVLPGNRFIPPIKSLPSEFIPLEEKTQK